MKEYEIFDEYLKESQKIREFCEDREKMLFESIRMEISTDGKIHWLNSIGYEIDKVLSYIDRLSNERKSQFNLKQ